MRLGLNGDFYVLTQGRQKFHEASDGKIASAVSPQQRDLRLLYAENFGGLDLCHATIFEDCIASASRCLINSISLVRVAMPFVDLF